MNGDRRAFEAAKATHIGDRSVNQDRCVVLANDDTLMLGLADGLGGHPRGEVAAQLLIDVCESLFRHIEIPIADPEHFMLQCIGKAHSSILRFGRRQDPAVVPRTTAVLAVVQHGVAHWAHVGDSRLYLLRNSAILARTRDHAQVRYVRESASRPSRPRSSLTRCLGGMPQPPVTTCGPPTVLQDGDTLLLCSDGLWGQMPPERLVHAFSDRSETLEARLSAIVERAAALPNSDNVTAVAVDWTGQAASRQAHPVRSDGAADATLEQSPAGAPQPAEKTRETPT